MSPEETRFLDHINGVLGWVRGMKAKEPGFIYDNVAEFDNLIAQAQEIKESSEGALDPKTEGILLELQSDINEVKRRKESPVRTPEEEAFYRHIVGINSYIRETKEREMGWIFDNVPEVEGLLAKVQELGTKDSDILAIMNTITKDIKEVISRRQGPEAAEIYQNRISELGIGKPLADEFGSK